jgi:hypothetical protein
VSALRRVGETRGAVMRRKTPYGAYAITFDPVMQRRQHARRMRAAYRFLVCVFGGSLIFAWLVMLWRGL